MFKVQDWLKTSLAPRAAVACALLLSACGQKGPLTLPTPDTTPPPPAAVAASASTPAR
ncbi:LPS translocon maturation chaperone LptM [Sphaerotilus sp.]|uniref:LPS translocon maturation chaperone LptM n=1 Tax=Sphaerotilus sp. TaxID=2093942 RepID=UPI00286E034F|nr:lipoprotein [Sphaerotilus sp.]